MKFLLCVFGILYIENTGVFSVEDFVTRVKEKSSRLGILGKSRPRTALSTVSPSPDMAFYQQSLPKIDTKSRSSSEDSIGTASTSPLSAISSSSSNKSISSISARPPTAAPSSNNSFQSRFSRSRRLAQQYSTTHLSLEDQTKISQAYAYLSTISDPHIQDQARLAVGAAVTANDKEQLAIAWKEHLSKIENDEERAAAAEEVQNTPTLFKQCVAEAWLEYLIKIPAGPVRRKAIADVRSAPSIEDKKLTAKIWEMYLTKIEDEHVQARAASQIRRVTYSSKEHLAQEWLRLHKTELITSTTVKPQVQTNSWWTVLSAIKDMSLKNEARHYIESELVDHDQRMEMARVWVQYLANIKDESARNIAFEEIKNAPSNRWKDIAADHQLQYRLQQEER